MIKEQESHHESKGRCSLKGGIHHGCRRTSHSYSTLVHANGVSLIVQPLNEPEGDIVTPQSNFFCRYFQIFQALGKHYVLLPITMQTSLRYCDPICLRLCVLMQQSDEEEEDETDSDSSSQDSSNQARHPAPPSLPSSASSHQSSSNASSRLSSSSQTSIVIHTEPIPDEEDHAAAPELHSTSQLASLDKPVKAQEDQAEVAESIAATASDPIPNINDPSMLTYFLDHKRPIGR